MICRFMGRFMSRLLCIARPPACPVRPAGWFGPGRSKTDGRDGLFRPHVLLLFLFSRPVAYCRILPGTDYFTGLPGKTGGAKRNERKRSRTKPGKPKGSERKPKRTETKPNEEDRSGR